MIELVVDGTDGVGKTLCAKAIEKFLVNSGYSVANYAPYREKEVYHLWKDNPEQAAKIIVDIMQNFRNMSKANDFIIWDRGWPTAYISTDDIKALSLFAPLPQITILLLGSKEKTIEKATHYKLKGVWVNDPVLIHKYNIAYHNIKLLSGTKILRFYPEKNDMFNFDEISVNVERVIRCLVNFGDE